MASDKTVRIEELCFGRMKINGEDNSKDLKIVNGKVKKDWWRGQGHLLCVEDIEDILDNSPEVLVVGAGMSGMMAIDDGLKLVLAEKGIALVVAKTDMAAEKYNKLQSNGVRVDGAFHLTC